MQVLPCSNFASQVCKQNTNAVALPGRRPSGSVSPASFAGERVRVADPVLLPVASASAGRRVESPGVQVGASSSPALPRRSGGGQLHPPLLPDLAPMRETLVRTLGVKTQSIRRWSDRGGCRRGSRHPLRSPSPQALKTEYDVLGLLCLYYEGWDPLSTGHIVSAIRVPVCGSD